MHIDAIQNGIVIDHIQAGKCMELYHFLRLEELDCSVAILRNVNSAKMGRKDIIKIDSVLDMDLGVLGYIDPGITISIIQDGQRVKKFHPELPERITNVITCKNPRCITTVEQEIPHIFQLTDRERRIYRCIYCESEAKK
ncbi:MAG TPA: aspartate carbamoyltransferase regulatory subunit [Candidatus Anaerotignum merdipullorum]|nr:aspartate carbamoyltransferase regulatory subunit [Candidatus Anaerotignum merdipullorum]